ncbi:MAG: ABC transporter permease [Bacteroidales bacterium]|jgi:lipopolysaccharide transport system permease protein|nr:ABC transporter permease [Bacteroidales bacterium]
MNANKEFSNIIIEPGRIEKNYWTDLWRYRELFYVLTWRDIKVRYKQTAIGVAWAVIRPLLTMMIFSVVFGKLAKLPSVGNAPYPIMVFAALLPWQFFSTSLTECSNSLTGNTNLISKIYFPRIIIPTSAIITSFIDFFISFAILVVIMLYYHYVPSWQIVFLPFFTILVFFTSFGIGIWLTALNVKYRDFRYIIPFIVQLGLYVSPVGFNSNIIPQKWMLIYSINPMVGIIDGFRWCIIRDNTEYYFISLWISIIVTLLFTLIGIRYFRRAEKAFADYI